MRMDFVTFLLLFLFFLTFSTVSPIFPAIFNIFVVVGMLVFFFLYSFKRKKKMNYIAIALSVIILSFWYYNFVWLANIDKRCVQHVRSQFSEDTPLQQEPLWTEYQRCRVRNLGRKT